MLIDGINTITTTAEQVNQWAIWMLYVISLLYLCFLQKKYTNVSYVKESIIGIIVICNPIFAGMVGNLLFSDNRYFRIIWILPIYIVIALSAADISEKKGKGFAILGIFILCLLGKWIGTGNYRIAENLYKIPQAAIDICEYMESTEEYQKGNIKISVDPKLSCYIRQYDGNIILQYGRQATVYTESEHAEIVFEQLNSENIDVEKLTLGLKADECDYVVVEEGKVTIEDMKKYGYIYQDTVCGYEIFKDDVENKI